MQRALSTIVGGIHTLMVQEHPQRIHLPQQPTHKAPRVISAVVVLVDQLTDPWRTTHATAHPWGGA